MTKVSIVIATLGREHELAAALWSVEAQSFRDIEVIIVDQNSNKIVDRAILRNELSFPIRHLRVDFRGASRARNFGSQMAAGDYIFFMDDDAELLADTLSSALGELNASKASGVFGRCVDRAGMNSVINFSSSSGYLSLSHMEGMFVESTLLIDKTTFLEEMFDDELGVGTFHGAEEAFDLILRLLKSSTSLYYSTSIRVYHPNTTMNYSGSDIRRVFTYRCGLAKVCAKHRLHKIYFKRLLLVFLALPAILLVKPNRFRYYLAEVLGLITGRIVP